MVTRADVARLAGVAPSTVTYVRNGTRPVSPAVRDRVLRAMAELGYSPNLMAAGLAGGRSRILALLLAPVGRPPRESDLEYFAGASDAAHDLGYRVLLWNQQGADLEEVQRVASGGLVDGVILMEVLLDDPRVEMLRAAGVPLSLIGRTTDVRGIPHADRDFAEVGRLAVAHLAQLGHRRVAFVDALPGDGPGTYAASARALEGVQRAARAHRLGLQLSPCALDVTAGRDLLTSLAAADDRVTAVIAFNDEATIGLVHAANRARLGIPADLSIISTSMSEHLARLLDPPITTISPPAARIGAGAARALIDELEGRQSTPTLLAGDLVDRGSTAAPRAGSGRPQAVGTLRSPCRAG